ncbi:condensation domain-containing protein, partial [Enterococcus faecium]|uniref:condensation domain-containing protein n=1 Tax=Enterococcus faecium TaxID=1352 RepID=UPI003F42BC67
ICDGQSVGILQKELWALYTALKERRATGLAPLAIQYGDVAASQRDWIETPEAKAQRDFWKKKLAAPLPVLDFPLDREPEFGLPPGG